MTVLVSVALVILGLVDGAFSGFRSSLGRTGMVDHVASDRTALRRGAWLVVVLTTPAVLALVVDIGLRGERVHVYVQAARTFLVILAPYAATVLAALAAYAALSWELKYLASALILGPFTLVRPYVAIAATVITVLGASDWSVAVAAALATAGVLLVEPVANRLYRRRRA